MNKKLGCIMLIDDDEDDNFYHQVILKEANVTEHIEVAESAFQALEYLKKEVHIPELIFLDINMPKMNGWEFLDEYQKFNTAQKARTIIIMLSTSLNPSDMEKAKKISAIKGFETKPLTEEIVKKIIDLHF